MAENKHESWETEEIGWARLTPQERFRQYISLLDYYCLSGGGFAPEHDSQSPFDFPEYYAQLTEGKSDTVLR